MTIAAWPSGVAGWMRYVGGGVDEQGKTIDVVDPLLAQYQAIHQQYRKTPEERVRGLLAIESIFGNDLPKNHEFVQAVTDAYQQLLQNGAKATVKRWLNGR